MSRYDFKLVFYQNITPLHIGCGPDVGLVDNPIIREKTTGFPFIPGSSIRGVLRDRCEGKEHFKLLFGPDPQEELEEDYAGCSAVFDSKILFFPVRTDKNLFHWITCPFVIDRFNQDMNHFNNNSGVFQNIEKINLTQSQFLAIEKVGNGNGLFLEEFPFTQFISNGESAEDAKPENFLKNWLIDTNNNFCFNERDQKKVIIVDDHVFDYFVQNATMIMQHNRLTSAKTVDAGALFSVESVPPETIFYGIIGGTQDRKNEGATFKQEESTKELFKLIGNGTDSQAIFNLGGDESTGLGVTKMSWKNGG